MVGQSGAQVGLAVGERRGAPQLGTGLRRQRRPAEPVRAGQVRRDALEDRAPDLAVAAQRGLRVRVGVDEARRDDPAGRVDDGGRGRVRQCPDRGDPAVAHGDVGDASPGAPVPSTTVAAADEEVDVHPQLSLPRARSGMILSTTPSAEADERVMTEGRRVVVVRDDLELLPDRHGRTIGWPKPDPVLRRQVDQLELRVLEDHRMPFLLGRQGLEPGVGDDTLGRRPAAHRRQDRQRVFEAELLEVAELAVERVHEAGATGLELGQPVDRGREHVVAGAAAADDPDRHAVGLDEPARLDQAGDRLDGLALLLLVRPGRQGVALVAHDPGEPHARCTGRSGEPARARPGPGSPRSGPSRR